MNTDALRPPKVVPAGLISAAGEVLGSPVASFDLMFGGFSMQANCDLHLEDGRRAVMKTAQHGDMMAMSSIPWTDIIDRESWMYRNLPDTAAYRPDYLGDVDADGWRGVIIEWVGDARRVPVWTHQSIEAVASGLADLHRLPKPNDLPPDIMRRTFPQPFLDRIHDRNRAPGRLPPAYTTIAWWDWFDSISPVLGKALDEFFGPLPYTFCHNDVRSDNMFIRDGKLCLLDWNQVVWSTPARDSVYWALGVEREGGGSAPDVFERYLAAGGFHPTDAAIRGCLAWWLLHSIDIIQNTTMNLPPVLLRIDQNPTILRWLVTLLDLPKPPVRI